MNTNEDGYFEGKSIVEFRDIVAFFLRDCVGFYIYFNESFSGLEGERGFGGLRGERSRTLFG